MDLRESTRRAVLVLLLALSTSAWADPPVQDEAPRPSPFADSAALSAPFDLKGDPKLSEGELEHILSGGSRIVAGDRILVASEPLTLGELVPLLKETSASGVQDLRRKQAEGGIKPEDRQEALRLLWERRNMLAPADVGFLEGLLARIYGKVPEKGKTPEPKGSGAAGSGRAPASTGKGAGAGGTGAGATGAARDELYVKLMDRLILEDRGNPAERKALEETVATMLRSPTARGIAAQFVELGATVKIGYVKMDNSTLTEERGKKEFTGTMGLTYTHRRPMAVEMNEFYLQTSPDRVENASNLAHELLGHAFRSYQAGTKGLTKVMDIYTDDETNSRLIGWVTQAELGGKLDSSLSWQYLSKPQDYYASMGTTHSYYAQSFTRQEMEDPVAVLRTRLADIARQKRSYEGWRGSLTKDRQAIQHFTTDPGHKKESPPSAFAMVRTETDNRLDTYIPQWLEKWTDMEKKVRDKVAYYESPAGRKDLDAVRAASQDPFFQELSREVARLGGVLSGISSTRDQAAETAKPPPTPGQITRERLWQMVEEDKKKHPEHWK